MTDPPFSCTRALNQTCAVASPKPFYGLLTPSALTGRGQFRPKFLVAAALPHQNNKQKIMELQGQTQGSIILSFCSSQSSIPVTDLTVCSKRQVLSDGYGQVLPDRYTYPEPQGPYYSPPVKYQQVVVDGQVNPFITSARDRTTHYPHP